MEEIVFKSDDLIVMGLINYFIAEKDYNPMIVHGADNEIWLENLSEEYKIIRIVSHHIHNKEQLDFDKFKLNKIVKQVKIKTLLLKVKVLNIYTDIEDDNILTKDDVHVTSEKDIDNPKLTKSFPDIVEKIKKKDGELSLELERTDDILAYLGEHKRKDQFICGFSMETSNMIENSRKKLEKKKIDMIAANNLKQEGAGFGGDTNIVTLITAKEQIELPKLSKFETACCIVDEILKQL